MAARITAYLVAFIVGTTFIAGLIVGAQRADDGPVDLIVVNGNVYTADADNPTAEAIAVQGNKILMVGSNREVQRLRRAQTVVVDAKGGTVLPGFNDAQLDLLRRGLALREADLLGARSLPEVEAAVQWWAAANGDRPWVTGGGWNYELFPGGLPTRQLLDAMVPDRPAFLTAHDGHTGWANSAALKLAGITRRTPNPPDGVIVKDPRTGEPTGALKRSAMDLVTTLLPGPTREQRLAALRDVMEQAHRRGVTSVQTASGSPEDLDLYDELRRKGELDLRVYASLSAEPGITAAQLDMLGPLREKYGDDPLFKAGAVTVIVDAESGVPGSTQPPLETLVADLDRRGWQVVIHAMGDRAVRMAVDAFHYVASQDTGAPRERRHRLEPLSVQASAADASVASQPPVAAPQPWIEARDVPELAAISKAGVAVSLQPSVADPLLGLQLAVNNAAADGEPGREWSAAERRGVAKAIDAYTRDAAWASFDEHRKGTLKRDMLADIVVLSRDIFSVSPSRLADTEVTVTIFNGKVVFSRAAETNE